MANMSYCRFQNTVMDMEDCQQHLDSSTLSKEEFYAMQEFVQICKEVARDANTLLYDSYEEYVEVNGEEEEEEEEEYDNPF